MASFGPKDRFVGTFAPKKGRRPKKRGVKPWRSGPYARIMPSDRRLVGRPFASVGREERGMLARRVRTIAVGEIPAVRPAGDGG